MRKFLLKPLPLLGVLVLLLSAQSASAQLCNFFINEIHYDNLNLDVDERVEIAGDAGTSMNGWKVYFYNGSDGTFYSSISLSGNISNTNTCVVGGRTLGFHVLDVFGITGLSFQNGAPDGLALVNPSNVVTEFWSYEGTFTASNGPANGMLSVDIGTSEPSTCAVGSSIQRTGASTWVFADGTNTFNAYVGQCNSTQFVGPSCNFAPTVSLSNTSVSCNGGTNGTITTTVTGGTSPYTYAWSDSGPATQNRTGMAAGTYTVTVTDNVSATGTASTIISQPPAIVLTETHTNVSCNGGANGTIDLTPTGGVPGYTYSWTGGATSQDRSGLTAGTYTVTVTDVNGCTKTLSATITQPAVISITGTLTHPTNCSVADGSVNITVTGGSGAYTYDWSNDGPEAPDNDLEDLLNVVEGTYTVTVTDANSCTKTSSFTLDYVDNVPPSLTCPANATVAANASCQATVGSRTAASVSDNCNPTPIVTQSPSSSTILTGHNTVQIVTLTADDQNGNTSTCTMTVTVKDVTPPTFTCQSNVTINANASCQGTLGLYTMTAVDNCTPSIGYGQDPSDGTILTGHNAVQVVVLSGTDNAGNTGSCSLTVTLKDVTPPTITCPANVTVNANASCQGQVGSYTAATLSDNCNPSPTVTQTPAPSLMMSGNNAMALVTLTANDGAGNTSTCSLTVTLKDVTPPTITCPANVTVAAGAGCAGTVGSYSPASNVDNCNPSPTFTQSPPNGTGFSGAQTVTLTADDINGNTSSCTFTVSVSDNVPPTITCPANATVNANASCQAQVGSYSAASVSDNCNANPTVTQSPVSTTLISGHNTVQVVTLTANDGSGNTATCTLFVTLKDVTPPSLTCPANATVAANASCQATVGTRTAATLSDNCNPSPTVTQSPAAATILSGHNTAQVVTLTANDGNGNTSTCTMTVTVKDVTPPVFTCQSNVTINANANCQGTLGLYTMTAIDNCTPSIGYGQDPADGTILTGHNAVQVVVLSGTDAAGNPGSCSLTVTLKDVTPPTLTCPANSTVAANANCQATIGTINPASLSDNCSANPSVSQSPAAATILNGHNASQVVTLTANDGNGNTATCTTTITVKDVTAPSLTCPGNTTINANASCQGALGTYTAATLSDNCNPTPVVTQSPASSTLLSGHNATQIVTLTANDQNGNTSTCTLTVTLRDLTPPSITCPANTTVSTGAACAGTLGTWLPTAMSDNCNANPTSTQNPPPSTPLSGNGATQLVTLTGNDGNGNTSTCSFTVTLRDVTPPTIVCPANITINANASCQGSYGNYTPVSLTDNCAPSPTFTQSPVGPGILSGHNASQLITLTGNDGNGNTATCAFSVILKDVTPPTLSCPGNITINANANCQGAIGSYLPATITDNCNPSPTSSQTPAPGTLITGHNTVQVVSLTASDGNGNTASCTLTVTLRDVTPPTIVCRNINADLNAQGTVTILNSDVFLSGSDNCGVVNLQPLLPTSTFFCNNIGPNLVVLTANDGRGNTATCSATVTVRDVTAPSTKCKNISANIGANGTVVIAPSQINNGSTDNCSLNLSLTPNTFTCADIGIKTVILRGTDNSGNSSTCSATVTLSDVSGPTAKCKNPSIYLDATGHATLTVADANNGSFDNCGISMMSISQTQFNCSDLPGSPWPVVLTVKDVNGNTSSCYSYVTVRDVIAPTAVCENVTVVRGSNGCAIVYGANLAAESIDNCSVWSYSPIARQYCAAGTYNLTVTVRDWSGNPSTCVSTITVVNPLQNPDLGNGMIDPGNSIGGDLGNSTDAFDFLLFPNPTADDVTLAFRSPAEQAYTLRLFDVNGRLVFYREGAAEIGDNSMRIELQDVPSGVYALDFRTDSQQIVQKLIIQRN